MAKFFGVVGYVLTEEVTDQPGVWEEKVVEKTYSGDILKNVRNWQSSSEQLLDNINVSNRVSILADAYANQNFYAIRYIKWMGASWLVTSVEVERPRLILTIGGVYNGPENSFT